MKVRNGFVSNSSSSSFVVFVPDDFTLDYKAIEEQYEDEGIDMDILKDMVNSLKKGHGLWRNDGWQEFDIIEEELRSRDLIVISMDSGPDEGAIDVITKKQVEDIYNKFVGGSK